MIHGDGWSAHWSAPHPVVGRARLRGTLLGDLGISSRQWVRGRIARVRVVTETIDTSAPDQHQWRRIPSGQGLREVEVAPRWFDRGLVASPDAPVGKWYSGDVSSAGCQAAGMVLLSVMVPATLIEDGETRPAMGQTVVFAVLFAEHTADDDDPGVMHLPVVADLRSESWRRRCPLGGEEYGDTHWDVLVRGDGWAASWSAPRPASGPMTLRGSLNATWDIAVDADARISGRVARVQVMSHTVEHAPSGAPPGTPQERRIPGTRQLRDVTTSPRWFTRGAREARVVPVSWLGEDGVLVDLEVGAAS